ncbi:MAG: hypothetical protein Q9195_004793 [Heterodermia aff. obscurata]
MPAVRGHIIAYWSETSNGTLHIMDTKRDGTRKITDIPRLGRMLIHDNLDIIIAFGHFEKPPPNQPSNVLADISMFAFCDPNAVRRIPSSQHERFLKTLDHSWLREGILRDPHLGTAAAFHMLTERKPFLIGETTLQAFAYGTIVYLADMDMQGPKKVGVKDLAGEGKPRWAELLDICYQPEELEYGEPDVIERELLRPYLRGDGTYVVQVGITTIQVWCFDEDIPLHQEDPQYWRHRTVAARSRAERRKEAVLKQIPCQSPKFRSSNSLLENIGRPSVKSLDHAKEEL